jgi:hypothetical protein
MEEGDEVRNIFMINKICNVIEGNKQSKYEKKKIVSRYTNDVRYTE